MERHLSTAWARGSKGGEDKASSTRDRSPVGILGLTGGRSLFAPLRNEDINRWPPTVTFPIGVCRDEIAATYTAQGGRRSSHLPTHQAKNLLHFMMVDLMDSVHSIKSPLGPEERPPQKCAVSPRHQGADAPQRNHDPPGFVSLGVQGETIQPHVKGVQC